MKVKRSKEKLQTHLTRTSKMPGLSYSLPAWACQTGRSSGRLRLTRVMDAMHKNKKLITPGTQQSREAQYRRLDAINHPQWVKQWWHKLNVKNGLDGMTPATFNQKSICKKL